MSDVAGNSVHPSMVNEWLSVEAAALRLGISSRSIARRVQNGQLESRVDANGRRNVLICLPATETSPIPESTTATIKEASVEQGVQPIQARELAQQAMTIVIRSHEESVLSARAEMFAAQRSTRRAWLAVAILLVGASVTVGLVTQHLTEAAGLVHQAEEKLDQSQAQVSHLAAERDQLRDQMVQARIKEAQAQGQLAGMTIKPTTRPGSVAQRVASILLGE